MSTRGCVLQDDASAGIQSLKTSIEIKLCLVYGTDFIYEVTQLFRQTRILLALNWPQYTITENGKCKCP